jgi:hypothetical protein
MERWVSQREKPGNEFADLIVDREPSFIMEFPEWDLEDPLIQLQMTKTIRVEANTFPDPHTCCSKEQQASV